MTFTATEAKDQFRTLLDCVARGEEVIVTRYGKPVARLVPERDLKKVRQAVADLRKLRHQIAERNKGKPELTWEEIKACVEEGRR